MFQWKRENLEGFPLVYARFQSRDFPGDALIEYRIQDLPEDRFEDAVKFLTEDFYLHEEPLFSAFEIKDDIDSLQEVEEFHRILFQERTALVCFKENSDEIIALNAMAVVATDEHEFNFPVHSQRLQKMLAVIDSIKSESVLHEPKDIGFVLDGKGLCVSPNYRRRGIATKMLEARGPFLQALGLTTTVTVFTAAGSQVAAKRAGFDEYCEVTYEALAAQGHIMQNVTEYSVKSLGYQVTNK